MQQAGKRLCFYTLLPNFQDRQEKIIDYLITVSEAVMGKSQTEALPF